MHNTNQEIKMQKKQKNHTENISMNPLKNHSKLVAILFALMLCFVATPSFAQVSMEDALQKQKDLAQAKFMREMDAMLNMAREAGFGEDEIRQITVERNGKQINVWEMIEQEKRRKQRAASLVVKPKDRYLTVQDITDEIESKDSLRLDILRKDLIFVGAEEK